MSKADPPLCTDTDGGIIITLHIQPRASKNEVCGIQDNALKIRLTSPPVDGAANKLCREFLAERFHVAKSAVEIVSGETSRHKRVKIGGKEPALLRRTLEELISQQR
ncbi:YggU family protein [Geobacter sp. FeAm09]|uniref:DUF167 domain-containing protein n=1 Tax=Geobacter sp. FeAm09 TaxID=2597769 RepID=UPI0011EE4753|nr:DUF167 domain-containing protein [Geobacter sp. FeAm09]QEM66858.1 YggU family protein [Geobacter sp. FeAm09]